MPSPIGVTRVVLAEVRGFRTRRAVLVLDLKHWPHTTSARHGNDRLPGRLPPNTMNYTPTPNRRANHSQIPVALVFLEYPPPAPEHIRRTPWYRWLESSLAQYTRQPANQRWQIFPTSTSCLHLQRVSQLSRFPLLQIIWLLAVGGPM